MLSELIGPRPQLATAIRVRPYMQTTKLSIYVATGTRTQPAVCCCLPVAALHAVDCATATIGGCRLGALVEAGLRSPAAPPSLGRAREQCGCHGATRAQTCLLGQRARLAAQVKGGTRAQGG